MSVEAAVRQFREAALAKGVFAVPAKRDHMLHDAMADALAKLTLNAAGRRALRLLLADESPEVRLWVASQLLSEGDVEAEKTLEAEVAVGGMHGFNAEVVLKEWRAGRLRSPFGAS